MGIQKLRAFAKVEIFLNRSRREILRKVARVEAVVCKSATRVNREFVDAAPRLRAVGRAGTGTDNFDTDYLREKTIPLLTVPGMNAVSAAEFTVMLILMLVKNARAALEGVERGDFRRSRFEGRELAALRVGIFGLGKVGGLVAQRLEGFGCRMFAFDCAKGWRRRARRLRVTPVRSPEELFSRSDLVSLHLNLNDTTRGIVNSSLLRRAPRGQWLVNTARGGLLAAKDLLRAIESGRLSGLAIDTLCPEPPFDARPGTHRYRHPFLKKPKILVFPHLAASTEEAQKGIASNLADRLRAVLIGRERRTR